MLLTDIIFRLFACFRPVLWFYHRLGRLLEAFVIELEREPMLLRLALEPRRRARWEAMLADGEQCLDIAIGLRARELLGWPAPGIDRPRIGRAARIHTPPTLEALVRRIARTIHRYNDIERLARLRAARIGREINSAPVQLVGDHRPQDIGLPLVMVAALSPLSQASSSIFGSANLPIRAPP